MRELIEENSELALGAAAAGLLIPLFFTMISPGGILHLALERFADSIC